MNDSRYDPDRIVTMLAKHQVRFVLVGGVAATLHGSPMLTADVDIAYERSKENLQRLARALREMRARLRGIEEDLPFKTDARTLEAGSNFTFSTDIGNLDCLGWVDGVPSYDALAQRAVELPLGARTVKVASLDDLIAMKRAAGRPKDRAALIELEALKDMT